MSNEELKAAAEQTLRPHWSSEVNMAAVKEFEALATPAVILDILSVQAQLAEANEKLCSQLEAMKRRLRHIPGTGQNESYLLADDVNCYVEEARAAIARATQDAP